MRLVVCENYQPFFYFNKLKLIIQIHFSLLIAKILSLKSDNKI